MMLLKMKTLYPDMITGDGIMSDLSDFDVPWDEITDTTHLDIGYYSTSANKNISPFLLDISGNRENIYNHEPIEPLTTEQRTKIAGVIFSLFHRKWEHFWNIYTSEYNPIQNYNMTENESIDENVSNARTDTGTITTVIDKDETNTGTVTNVVDKDETNTGTVTNVIDSDSTDTGTVSDSGSNTNNVDVFGFNSSNAVGYNESDGTNSNTRTNNLSSTDDVTNTRTDNLTHTDDVTNTRTDNLSHTDDVTNTETHNLTDSNSGEKDVFRELTREGNIGVMSTQQMISQELDVWQWSFFKSVFQDIDSVCCLDIY